MKNLSQYGNGINQASKQSSWRYPAEDYSSGMLRRWPRSWWKNISHCWWYTMGSSWKNIWEDHAWAFSAFPHDCKPKGEIPCTVFSYSKTERALERLSIWHLDSPVLHGLRKDNTGCFPFFPFFSRKLGLNPGTTLLLLKKKWDREGRTPATGIWIVPICPESKNWDFWERELFDISLNSNVQNLNISNRELRYFDWWHLAALRSHSSWFST